MLKKVEIKEPGDTDFLLNETVDIIDIVKINEDLRKMQKNQLL